MTATPPKKQTKQKQKTIHFPPHTDKQENKTKTKQNRK